MRFQHWWFINRGYAKLFINLGGPTFFKLPKKLGQWWLINLEGLINPNLALHGKNNNQHDIGNVCGKPPLPGICHENLSH